MGKLSEWWAWLYDRGSHSYAWALFLAVNCADAVGTLNEVSGGRYWFRMGAAVLFAKWAHTVWHQAEQRRMERARMTHLTGRRPH